MTSQSPVPRSAFKGLGWNQRYMLRFIKRTSAGKRGFHIAKDRATRRAAVGLETRGIITADKAYTNWLIRLTVVGRAWLRRRSSEEICSDRA